MIILVIMKVSRLVNFRLAKKYDIDKICEIVEENVILMNKNGNFQWSEKYPLYEDFYGDYLKNSLYVLENNEILGFLTLDFNKPEEYKDILWKNEKKSIYLHRMAVSKIYHKKGTGFKLLKYVYDISKQLNVDRFTSASGPRLRACRGPGPTRPGRASVVARINSHIATFCRFCRYDCRSY